MLTGQTPGPVNPSVSVVSSFMKTVIPSPTETLGTTAVPADGSTNLYVTVNLYDTNGNVISGKTVTLAANSGSHASIGPASGSSSINGGLVTFQVTDLTPEVVTFTATDATDGIPLATTAQMSFVTPPATSARLQVAAGSVPDDGVSEATITIALAGVGTAIRHPASKLASRRPATWPRRRPARLSAAPTRQSPMRPAPFNSPPRT